MKTKRFLWVLLALLITSSLVLSACGDQVETQEADAPAHEGVADLEGRKVTFAVENAYLPFNYIDPDTGEPAGWDYDVFDAICEELNCVPEYIETSWETMIQAVADGQFDIAGDGITITEERAKKVDYSVGYIAIEQRLLVRTDEDRIESMDDIVADETLKLGTQTGTTNYETAAKHLPEDRITAFEQFPFAVGAVLSGDIDAVIIDEVAGQGYMGESAGELKLVGPSLSSDMLGFIFPPGSDLVEPVNKAIEKLAQNGFLEEVNAQYFGPDFVITYDDLFPPDEDAGAELPLVCFITDLAGVDDMSFNALGWKGVNDAVAAGFAQEDPILLESKAMEDYEPNIAACLNEGATHVVTSGWAIEEAVKIAAAANPDVKWTFIDAGGFELDNVRELVYQTDEPAFAAGYLAAGVTKTGVVGTYGGANYPTVMIFMDGMARGVAYYNELKGTDVEVVGWNVELQDGQFTGSFTDMTVARAFCEGILDEGADVMLPVGGAINLPCGDAITARGLDAALIGVDADAAFAMPEAYKDLWLITITKGIDLQVTRSLQDDAEGNWTGGGTLGTAANGAVGLSPLNSWEDKVDAELWAETQALFQAIVDGEIDAAVVEVISE